MNRDCASNCCTGECNQGRDCPLNRRPTRSDIRIVRAITLYAVVFWLAIGGAALWCWPQ